MSQQSHENTRVLVADDDQSIRQLVCNIIQREGLEVDCAGDGTDAIQLLREHEYAVILLDLMMPRTDGFEVIEHLKEYPQARKPVVLVITAYADQTFKKVDPEIVAGVLRKPFEVAELGSVIRNCVLGFQSAFSSIEPAQDTASAGELAGWQLRESLPTVEDDGTH
jgi:CheY-like chemotaxis protein